MSGTWGEFLRLRGRLHAAAGRAPRRTTTSARASASSSCSASATRPALGSLELGRLAAAAGARSRATRYLADARRLFEALGAAPELARDRGRRCARLPPPGPADTSASRSTATMRWCGGSWTPPAMPALLEREGADRAPRGVRRGRGRPGRVSCPAAGSECSPSPGCDADARAGARRRGAPRGRRRRRARRAKRSAATCDGARFAVISLARPLTSAARQRFRTLCAVLRQGFDLCQARERPPELAPGALERQLEPLLPGFVCASAAMQRVADQIQRLQGNDLTVLITGESGTGKDLVARAIHAGSPRRANMFLPYNCTSATRELADSQLFGHRRGSFTGAVADQPGVLRTAVGGTLFLDEVGDLPLDVQPKLLRFLEQGEVLPVGETRPQRVDVRVVAATNADLEQRVADGKFREDLFYRLSVIRIHVPPLRERREEIPHLSTFFLREACERLGKPGVRLSPETLDIFDAFRWPGNVRQLRNEVQRAVALTSPEGVITPEMLSPAFGSFSALDTQRGSSRAVAAYDPCRRRGAARTRDDRRRAADIARQHLRDRAGSRADPPRALSEDAAAEDPQRAHFELNTVYPDNPLSG